MKKLILILCVVLLAGCSGESFGLGPEGKAEGGENAAFNAPPDNNATQPVRTLTAEEKKVVGEYEFGGSTTKSVLLQNGACEVYVNGKKEEAKLKWSISNEEIHVNDSRFSGNFVYRLNKDKSITYIAKIIEGKRKAIPKDEQLTYKKIK